MAYVNQYAVDQANDKRISGLLNQAASGVAENFQGFVEDRRRALEGKRKDTEQNFEYAKMGATPIEIKEMKANGFSQSLFDKHAAKAEAARVQAQKDSELDRSYKQSQINKNNREASNISDAGKPYLETAKGKEFIAKEDYKNKNKIGGKNAHEFNSRMANIIGEADQLKTMISDKGTFELTGPHNQNLAQKVDSIAIDAAKLFDPESVARDSEVAAFRKMLFEPGTLTTSNNTAIGTIDGFKKLVQDRAARSQSIDTQQSSFGVKPEIKQKIQMMSPEQKQARAQELLIKSQGG